MDDLTFLISMVNDICGNDLFSAIYNTLSVNLFSDSGTFGPAYTVVRLLYNTIMPVGAMLMFVYFIASLVDKASSENFTWEQFWRQLAMLLAAKFLMEHGLEILELLFGIGMSLAAMINNVGLTQMAPATYDAEAMIQAWLDNMDWWKWLEPIILTIYLLIPWALSWVMGLCVNIICWSRVAEIYARVVFTPIALADFFNNGMNGSGWKSLKSFLAVCLQGPMILAIAILFSRLFASIMVNSMDIFAFLGAYVAFYAASIMLMFKSLSLTKELVGAT